jgi:tetratricopeptide (TPR) repeat protein
VAADLVRLCGGMPLALRITGSRLAARPYWRLSDLATRLADEQKRLDEFSYGTLEVRASLAMSWHGLDERARTLFRRLGWLGVPGTAAWVSAALLEVEVAEAEEVLGSLIDARLLEAGQRDSAGFLRYGFHELVRMQAREYALAEESAEGLTAAAQRAFGCWLSLAEEAHRRESGGDYTLLHGIAPRWRLDADLVDLLLADTLRWFESERQCLLDVVRRAAVLGMDEVCWDLAVTSVTLYEAGSYLDDWRQTHERALAAVRRQRNVRGEAAILESLGSLQRVLQRADDARGLLEPALRLFEQEGERHGQALAMRNLAYLDRSRGQFAQAMQRYQTARELLHESGDLLAEAHVLGGMAQIHLDCGDDLSAKRLLTQSLAISQRIGSKRGESQARYRLGEVLARQDALTEAEEAFRRTLELVEESRDAIGKAYALLGLGETLTRQQLHASAGKVLQEALHLARTLAEPLVEARTLLALGRRSSLLSQRHAAIAYLEHALRMFEALQAPHWQARVLTELSDIYAAAGQRGDADNAQRAAERQSERIRPVTAQPQGPDY